MIGLRTGLKSGIRAGIAAGVSADPISPDSTTSTTLTIAVDDSADPQITAINFTYSVIVTNTGVADATSVSASLALDASLTYVSASGTGWTVDASALPTVTFTRATLAAGAAPTITVTVTSGGSATTTSSTGNVSASNAPAATPDTETTVIKLVAKDATSGIRVPATSTQWTDLLAYFGVSMSAPNSLWLCQEASGNLADSIGSLTLTASGAPSYQQAVAGWTRKGVSVTDNSSMRFGAAAGVGPNPTTTSTIWLALSDIGTVTGTRMLICAGGNGAATDCSLLINTTPRMVQRTAGVSATGTADPVTGGVSPFALQYNRAGTAVRACSDLEKLDGTYSAAGVLDGLKGLYQMSGAQSVAGSTVYMCMWSGAAAEVTAATIKGVMTALGYSPPWS